MFCKILLPNAFGNMNWVKCAQNLDFLLKKWSGFYKRYNGTNMSDLIHDWLRWQQIQSRLIRKKKDTDLVCVVVFGKLNFHSVCTERKKEKKQSSLCRWAIYLSLSFDQFLSLSLSRFLLSRTLSRTQHCWWASENSQFMNNMPRLF